MVTTSTKAACPRMISVSQCGGLVVTSQCAHFVNNKNHMIMSACKGEFLLRSCFLRSFDKNNFVERIYEKERIDL